MKTLGPRTEATPLSSGGSGRLYRLCLPAGAVKPPRLFIVDRRDRSSSLFAFPRGPYALSSSLKRCEKSKTPSRAVLCPRRRLNFLKHLRLYLKWAGGLWYPRVPYCYCLRRALRSPHPSVNEATTRTVARRCLSCTPIGIPPVKLKLRLP